MIQNNNNNKSKYKMEINWEYIQCIALNMTVVDSNWKVERKEGICYNLKLHTENRSRIQQILNKIPKGDQSLNTDKGYKNQHSRSQESKRPVKREQLAKQDQFNAVLEVCVFTDLQAWEYKLSYPTYSPVARRLITVVHVLNENALGKWNWVAGGTA